MAVKLEKNNAHGTKMKMRRPRKSRRVEKSIWSAGGRPFSSKRSLGGHQSDTVRKFERKAKSSDLRVLQEDFSSTSMVTLEDEVVDKLDVHCHFGCTVLCRLRQPRASIVSTSSMPNSTSFSASYRTAITAYLLNIRRFWRAKPPERHDGQRSLKHRHVRDQPSVSRKAASPACWR